MQNIPGSFPLLELPINYPSVEVIQIPYIRTVNEGNLASTYVIQEYALRKYQVSITGTTADVYTYILFFADRQARLKRFYLQELQHSMTLKYDIDGADMVITMLSPVIQKSITDLLYIEKKDGTIHIQQVDHISTNEITLVGNLGEDILKEDVAGCGWCFRARFDKDSIELTYPSSGVITECAFEVIEVLKTTDDPV